MFEDLVDFNTICVTQSAGQEGLAIATAIATATAIVNFVFYWDKLYLADCTCPLHFDRWKNQSCKVIIKPAMMSAAITNHSIIVVVNQANYMEHFYYYYLLQRWKELLDLEYRYCLLIKICSINHSSIQLSLGYCLH